MSATQLIMLGEGAGGGPVTYIEDVFSTYLYTGNGSTQTITNGIDLSTKGGLVWAKARSSADNHGLYDTARGVENRLISNSTAAQSTASGVTAFNTNGFSLGSNSDVNGSGKTTVSWTFRKQPKFFDVVTYTGNGVSGRSISHNLGSVPGCIIIKSTTRVSDWVVYHQSVGSTKTLILNSTVASADYGNNISSVTSTSFNVTGGSDSNANGDSYVAYIYAHNAGGFGLTGTDNVISCGSVTANGSGAATINLGYEPQWIMLKNTTSADSWLVFDNMRGLFAPTQLSPVLRPNITNAEVNSGASPRPSATGVSWTAGDTVLTASNTYIYIAIRRGPMKVPTSGTSVFEALAYQGTGASSVIATTNVADLFTAFRRNDTSNAFAWATRLIGANAFLTTQTTNAENTQANTFTNIGGKTITVGSQGEVNQLDWNYIGYYISRAPNFMDVVCYTGTGAGQTVAHNLGVAPELVIYKRRNGTGTMRWATESAYAGSLYLELTNAASGSAWNLNGGTGPTSSIIYTSSTGNTNVNVSGSLFVAYLFATCAGVSKVGSYTGTAATQTINCGFTTGARFILIKRTDSTGDWYIWDSTRGITATNDPYFLANSYSAEVTNTNYVDAYSTGFQVRSAASTTVNVNGASYIFLAIA